MKKISLVIAMLISSNLFAESDLFGYWLTPGSIVLIENCDKHLCAKIETIFVEEDRDPKSILDDIINHQHGSLLSLTFILTFYFATNGVNTMITCFNATYHLKDKRTWLQLKVLSIVLTLILALLFLLTIALQIFSLEFLNSLVKEKYLAQYAANLIIYAKWLIFVFLLFISISILYYYGPADKSGWKFLSAGSITATILSVITSLGFSYYVDNFSKYNELYGSIGTLLVILLWMYFNSIILLLGFELNASIMSAKEKQNHKSEYM